MTDTVMTFRVDSDLKKAFETAAKSTDLTSSQLLRSFMRETVATHMRANAQQELFSEKKQGRQPKASSSTKKPAKTSGNKLLDGLMKKGGY